MAHPNRSETPPLIFPSSPEEPAPGVNRRRNSLPLSFDDDGANTNPNISSVLVPHPSTIVIRSWEVGIFTDRQIAESCLSGIVGGGEGHCTVAWGSAFRYYSICYYAGTVVIARKLFDVPGVLNLTSSPATGTPCHPFPVTSSPATGTPNHPYGVSSSPLRSPFSSQASSGSTPIPTFGLAHHQATTGLRSISASFAPALSQGSPTPASRTRQFLLQAPPAMPTELTSIVSAAPIGSSATPAAPIFLLTILTNTNPTAPSRDTAAPPAVSTSLPTFLSSILTNTNPINALVSLVVYISSDSESESEPIPHSTRLAGYRSASACLAQDESTGPIVPSAAATAGPTIATLPRRIVFIADFDSEDYAVKTPLVARLSRYPSASVHFSRAGRSTCADTTTPTNTATWSEAIAAHGKNKFLLSR
ncbi:hypothetical protein GALMADRAFT_140953 [Galerina marginata CBS 339.88]|uniref:Uncharacterized protein n=1 Tax=Galerina marginata (strain CBS 339.88) TaxID=685588 RepID=A0A067T6E1_GALM3|nr:hypothetical protein GALMADRAFT_140953 [Galerina marginata CBS 339.88]